MKYRNIGGHKNSNKYIEIEEKQKGTYSMRESFGSANKTLAIITCHVHTKLKYSRYFKTKAETKLALFCHCDIVFKI